MKSPQRRARSTSGETVIETMVGLVIAALSLMLLLTTTLSSAAMDRQARAAEQRFIEHRGAAELEDAWLGTAGHERGTVLLGSTSYDVMFHGGDDVLSYSLVGE